MHVYIQWEIAIRIITKWAGNEEACHDTGIWIRHASSRPVPVEAGGIKTCRCPGYFQVRGKIRSRKRKEFKFLTQRIADVCLPVAGDGIQNCSTHVRDWCGMPKSQAQLPKLFPHYAMQGIHYPSVFDNWPHKRDTNSSQHNFIVDPIWNGSSQHFGFQLPELTWHKRVIKSRRNQPHIPINVFAWVILKYKHLEMAFPMAH